MEEGRNRLRLRDNESERFRGSEELFKWIFFLVANAIVLILHVV
jgi:hypothetical protein